jgi:hypothetical protein
MFLLTVIFRAFFCGASFLYYSELVWNASSSKTTRNIYAVNPFLLLFFSFDGVTAGQASCYMTGVSLFVTILLIGKALTSPHPSFTL